MTLCTLQISHFLYRIGRLWSKCRLIIYPALTDHQTSKACACHPVRMVASPILYFPHYDGFSLCSECIIVTLHYLPGFLSDGVPRIRCDTIPSCGGRTLLGTTPHLPSPHDAPRLLDLLKCTLLPLFLSFSLTLLFLETLPTVF